MQAIGTDEGKSARGLHDAVNQRVDEGVVDEEGVLWISGRWRRKGSLRTVS